MLFLQKMYKMEFAEEKKWHKSMNTVNHKFSDF